MISSSTSHPWSDIKAQATTDLASSLWSNPNIYNTTAIEVVQNYQNAVMHYYGANSLLYVLNSVNSSSITYRNNIIAKLNDFPAYWTRLRIATAGDTGSYYFNSTGNSVMVAMTLALDVIHDDLTQVQIDSYAVVMDSWVVQDRLRSSQWQIANYGMRSVYDLYRDTDSFQLGIDTTCYHVVTFPNDTGVTKCGEVADNGKSSEHSFAQFNRLGGHGEGGLYAWARMGGASYEKLAKWGSKYIVDFATADAILADTRWKNAVEWMYAGYRNPLNERVAFGDTNNSYLYGDDYFGGVSASSYTISNLEMNIGRFSSRAAGWAQTFLNNETRTLQYPSDLLTYATATDLQASPTSRTSMVLSNTGAAFWDEDQSTQALYTTIFNSQVTRQDHLHQDQGAVYMAGYGEVLLTNAGYAGTGAPIGGFPYNVAASAYQANNVLIDNIDFYGKNLAGQPYPQWGGNGIAESLLSDRFDYADAISTDPYTMQSPTTQNVTTGPVLFVDGIVHRNLFFVHADTTTSVNGYFVMDDEVVTSTSPRVNVLWRPYSNQLDTTTLSQEYRFPVARHKSSTTTLNIFLATPPQSVSIASTTIGIGVNVTYGVDVSSCIKAVTVLYPSDSSHAKSTFTRLASGDAQGATILSGSTTDYFMASTGSSTVSMGASTFIGKAGFWRNRGGTQQFFVRQGTSFNDGSTSRSGFSSSVPVSMHLRGKAGTMVSSTTANVTFYYPLLSDMTIDGAAATGTAGSGSFATTVSSGNHALALTDNGTPPAPAGIGVEQWQ